MIQIARLMILIWIALSVGGCKSSVDQFFADLDKKFKPKTPRDYVKQMLNVRDADQRREGIDELIKTPTGRIEASVRIYILILKSDRDAQVRSAAARALGLARAPQGGPALLRALSKDRSGLVRLECAKALAAVRPLDAPKSLTKHLTGDPDKDVRMACARTLVYYGDREILQPLITALGDPEFGVVYEAHTTLKQLTGQSFNDDPARWHIWLTKTSDPLAGGAPAKYSPPDLRSWWDKVLGKNAEIQKRKNAETGTTNPAPIRSDRYGTNKHE